MPNDGEKMTPPAKNTNKGQTAPRKRKPVIETTSDDNGSTLYVELPGVEGKDINVDFDGSKMKITAGSGDRLYAGEKKLGFTPDMDRMEASLDNGILTIFLPKVGGDVKTPLKSQKGCEVEDVADRAQSALADAEAKAKALEESLETVSYQLERYKADFANFRNRSAKDKEDHAASQMEAVMSDLVPVLDTLDLALDSMVKGGMDERYIKGIEGVRMHFLQSLEKNGITRIDCLGKQFDPALHHSIGTVDDDSVEEETIVRVQREGFMFAGKVIREPEVFISSKGKGTGQKGSGK